MARRYLHIVIPVSPGGGTPTFGSKTTRTAEHKVAVISTPNVANRNTRVSNEWCCSPFHP